MLNTKFFKLKEKHIFHLVDPSQLPFMISIAIVNFLIAAVAYLHKVDSRWIFFYFHVSAIFFTLTLFAWFVSVVWESGEGYHTRAVRTGLRLGMALFIVSEVLFFFAFFWGFFHYSLSPSIAIGGIWPPKSIQPLDIWGLPLVNTLLLLSSGVTITLAHHSILVASNYSNHLKFTKHLFVTIILGLTFLICQGIEYKYGVNFSWKENIYGTVFFVTTGFHGLHVTIGTIFLLFCLLRELSTFFFSLHVINRLQTLLAPVLSMINNLDKNKIEPTFYNINDILLVQNYISKYGFNKDQHFGFEAAAWYWHFVDVVWIFLFLTIYWWGS